MLTIEYAVLLQTFGEVSGSWMHGKDPIDRGQTNTMIERELKDFEKNRTAPGPTKTMRS